MLIKFKELRKKEKLTQKQVAELVGLKQRVISKYENQESEMPVRVAKKLAPTLKVNWWELYEE